jgi:hypothetical protein
MAYAHPIENVDALLERPNRISVEVRGALLELSEVFHRAKAALGPVNLLIEQAL